MKKLNRRTVRKIINEELRRLARKKRLYEGCGCGCKGAPGGCGEKMRKRHPAEYTHAMSYPGYGKGMYGDDEGDYSLDYVDDDYGDQDDELILVLKQLEEKKSKKKKKRKSKNEDEDEDSEKFRAYPYGGWGIPGKDYRRDSADYQLPYNYDSLDLSLRDLDIDLED